MAVVNGLFGDALYYRESPLATQMTIRAGSTVLPLERDVLPDVLAGAVGQVGSRICLLVHGLMSTESVWQFPDDASTTYGTLLAGAHGVTPLSLRYNTGRRVSANGRELAQLLNRLLRAWPVRVREINLIGHSMGGLVIRSACYYARTVRPRGRHLPIGRRWTTKVRRVVLVGVPNTGAPLEALVNATSSTLWSLPVPATRLVGLGLDSRSGGIKDLRFGNILDEDWLEQDPGARVRTQPHRRRARHLVERRRSRRRRRPTRTHPGRYKAPVPQDDPHCACPRRRRLRRHRRLVAILDLILPNSAKRYDPGVPQNAGHARQSVSLEGRKLAIGAGRRSGSAGELVQVAGFNTVCQSQPRSSVTALTVRPWRPT